MIGRLRQRLGQHLLARPVTPARVLRSRWGTDRSVAAGGPPEPLGRARLLGLGVWLLFIFVPVVTAITP